MSGGVGVAYREGGVSVAEFRRKRLGERGGLGVAECMSVVAECTRERLEVQWETGGLCVEGGGLGVAECTRERVGFE